MMLYPPHPLTITSVEEHYQECEERMNAADRVLNNMKSYVQQFPNSPRKKYAQAAIEKYQHWRRIWIEEQLRCEEWLIDHQAKGWVST